ncbi:hypothetical protein LBW89_11820 [Paenibacillus sp. alder61]|uniref:hypothetical protein n=1 Tax=Paenibacillus TaxID=44249 RepID=UPI001CD3475C|nr:MULTISPECIES: hypothetical protein [Paenibacillus]MCA1293704.1 hypothetical protein [Paenibacillus sp. alder61]
MKSKNKQTTEAAGISGKTASEAEYPLEELAEHSAALLGVNREVLLGAVHGASRNHFSVEEARQRVQQFLKRKVQ